MGICVFDSFEVIYAFANFMVSYDNYFVLGIVLREEIRKVLLQFFGLSVVINDDGERGLFVSIIYFHLVILSLMSDYTYIYNKVVKKLDE